MSEEIKEVEEVEEEDIEEATEITVQDVVKALEFIREEVFSQENITHVKDIADNLAVLGEKAKAAYNKVKNWILAHRQKEGINVRSLELTRALDKANVKAIYDQFERVV